MPNKKKKEINVAVDCSNCSMKVNAKIISQHTENQSSDWEFMANYLFLECPACKNVLLARRFLEYDNAINNFDWTLPLRVWPEEEKSLSSTLPILVKKSLEEAMKCYKAKAYWACAVMCRRTLESICSENGIKKKTLDIGLKELLDRKIIDLKIFKWSQELRTHGNIGAHAIDKQISVSEAKDLLDFSSAICDYVFVLNEKFENFMKRKSQKTQPTNE
jgi:hypothetical protein